MRFERVLLGACGMRSAERMPPFCQTDARLPSQAGLPAGLLGGAAKVPPGLDTPDTKGARSFPTVELTAPRAGPHDACLDVPPRYKPAPSNKAASG